MAALHIFLQVLKWLGIALGGVVGLVLLIVLLILFVPIRYKIYGQKYETAEAHVKVSWLLCLVRFLIDWEAGRELVMKAKVLFFTVWKNEGENEEEEPEDEGSESPEAIIAEVQAATETEPDLSQIEFEEVELPATTNIIDMIAPDGIGEECEVIDLLSDEETPDIFDEEKIKEEKRKIKEAQKAERKAERERKKAEKARLKAEKAANAEKKSLDERLDEIYGKISGILNKPAELLEKFNRKKEVIENFLNNKRHKAGALLAKDILIKLLKAIAPRSGKGKLTFGTGDPASTGYALAGLAVLYSKLGSRMQITPDFEEKVITGDGYIKGRIFLITIVVLFCKLWFDKDFKKLKESASTLKERVTNA